MSDSKGIGTSKTSPLHTNSSSISPPAPPFIPETGGDTIFPMRTVSPREVADHAMAQYVLIRQMASVQRLARELTHDFRNMLLSISGLVLQMERAQPTDVVTGSARAIRTVLSNLEDMVNNLHSLGSPEGSGPCRVIQDLSLEVGRIIEIMRSSIEEGIELKSLPCSEPLTVLITRGALSRVVGNLLFNGCDAMSYGGELQVSLHHRRLNLEYCRAHGNARPGYFGVLRVDDQGSGIPPEVLPPIFEPLFSTKTVAASTDGCKRGWGLAKVYALVPSHDGWIDVETHPGLGTHLALSQEGGNGDPCHLHPPLGHDDLPRSFGRAEAKAHNPVSWKSQCRRFPVFKRTGTCGIARGCPAGAPGAGVPSSAKGICFVPIGVNARWNAP
jgi:signal transduction histidine kinase